MIWKEWKTIKKGDYLYAKIPQHPKANKNGYVLEHRIVMENRIGRLLLENEEVHHIDENRHNNNPENLEIMIRGEHQRFHKTIYPNGHFVKLICDNCGTEFERDYNQRKEVKGSKKVFCSRKCNGLFNGFK